METLIDLKVSLAANGVQVVVMICLGIFCLYLLRQRDRYFKEARHDFLTGLLNMRGMEERIEHFRKRAEFVIEGRASTSLGVLFIDINDFGQVNKRFGQDVGNFVLREVAKRILITARPGDLVVRFGGEEFLIFFACPGPERAQGLAVSVYKAIARTPITTNEGTEHNQSASIGWAIAETSQETVTSIINRADQRMQRVKKELKHTEAMTVYTQ